MASETKKIQICSTPCFESAAIETEGFSHAWAKHSKVWKQSQLNFKFVGSSEWSRVEKAFVEMCMEAWTGEENKRTLSICFVEAPALADEKADIRIAKQTGTWRSQIGNDAKKLTSGPTMYLGDVTNKDLHFHILHELGHALGLEHEHQSAAAVAMFDQQKVFAYFGGQPNNWTEQQTRENILSSSQSSTDVVSAYDSDSIMHYYFPPELLKADVVKAGKSFKVNRSITRNDLLLMQKLYPLKGTVQSPTSSSAASSSPTSPSSSKLSMSDSQSSVNSAPDTATDPVAGVPKSGGTPKKDFS